MPGPSPIRLVDGSWVEVVVVSVTLGLVALTMARNRRTAKDRPHALRAWLGRVLARWPGLSLQWLSESARVDRRTIEYHLDVLERFGEAYGLRLGPVKGFFAAGTPVDEAESILLLRRGRVLEMVSFAAQTPGCTQTAIATSLGMRRRLLRAYADLLVEGGLLEERHEGAKRIYYATPKLCRILPLIGDEAEPGPAPPGSAPPGGPGELPP